MSLFGAAASTAQAKEIADVTVDIPDTTADEVRDEDSAFAESAAFELHDSSCSSDNQCGACQECLGGYCKAKAPGGDGCALYSPCSNGFLCLPSATTACATECVDTECATSVDCGKCGTCSVYSGKCTPIKPKCTTDLDCPKYQYCQVNSTYPCLSYCLYKAPPDVGQSDGGTDGSVWDLAVLADTGIVPDESPADGGASLDGSADTSAGAAASVADGQRSGCGSRTSAGPNGLAITASFSLLAVLLRTAASERRMRGRGNCPGSQPHRGPQVR